jgi:hypothetical protein
MTVSTDFKQLYATDDNLWLLETIELLKQKRLDELDLDNLIEELESMGRRDVNKAKSLLRQIIIHLLLLQYWQLEVGRNYHHWRGEIKTFRYDLNNHLTTNLKNKLQENLVDIYHSAVDFVKEKTGFTIDFPKQCPYTIEELLDENYF